MIQKSSKTSVSDLITKAWDFLRDHPVFVPIIVWLGVVPGSSLDFLWSLFPASDPAQQHLQDLCLAVVRLLFAYWSLAAILLVGKRLLKQKAGRKRSSLLAVIHESAPLLIPLVCTSLLRACIAIYWALLLIIPALVYLLKTTFYPIAMVIDDAHYRAALKRSSELVTGRFWEVAWTLLLLVIILIAPAELAFYGLEIWLTPLGRVPELIALIVGNTLEQTAIVMLILSMIGYYGELTHAKAQAEAKRLHSGTK